MSERALLKVTNFLRNRELTNIKQILSDLMDNYVDSDGTTSLAAEWDTGDYNMIGPSAVYVGNLEPLTTYAYMLWHDNSIATRVCLKRRNANNNDWETVYSTETASRTIDFVATDTAAMIQADIDEIGKHLQEDVEITCQFADGTYTLSSELTFNGFYGGGKIYVYGNSSDNSLSMTKAVDLVFSGSNIDGIRAINCSAEIWIRYLHIAVDTSSTDRYAITFDNCQNGVVYDCYCFGNDDTNGACIFGDETTMTIASTYVADAESGILCHLGRIYSKGNDEDAGNQPKSGLSVTKAGTIGKNGTQPAGSVANETTAYGGVIR